MSIPTKIIGNDSELDKILNRHFRSKVSRYIEATPKKIVLPGKYSETLESIKNFEVRDGDVFIFGFLKTGSRLTQELTWLLLNNLDFKTAKEVFLELRAPYFEIKGFVDDMPEGLPFLCEFDEMKSPRCFKSHLQWDLIPEAIRNNTKQTKIIIVMRGPEDVCTSYYHQSKAGGYTGTFEEFCAMFLGGRVPFGPYWNHVLGFWEQRHRSNVLLLKYNEMVGDLTGTIRNVAKFLGKTLSEDDVANMYEHLKFDNLKRNKMFNLDIIFEGENNPLARKGVTGDHKNVMSPEVMREFQEQRGKYLSGTGLSLV